MTKRNDCPKGWRCSVRRRAVQNAYRRSRMDDPLFRLSEGMRISALHRRQTIERMKEAIG